MGGEIGRGGGGGGRGRGKERGRGEEGAKRRRGGRGGEKKKKFVNLVTTYELGITCKTSEVPRASIYEFALRLWSTSQRGFLSPPQTVRFSGDNRFSQKKR